MEVDIHDGLPVSSLELRCIEVKPIRAKPFFVVSWYRPPSDLTETFDKFEEVLKCLESEGKEIIVLGDTNCDVILFTALKPTQAKVYLTARSAF